MVGLFSIHKIPKGAFVAQYLGEYFPETEVVKKPRNFYSWIIQYHEEWYHLDSYERRNVSFISVHLSTFLFSFRKQHILCVSIPFLHQALLIDCLTESLLQS
jgi:hypothetical protein